MITFLAIAANTRHKDVLFEIKLPVEKGNNYDFIMF